MALDYGSKAVEFFQSLTLMGDYSGQRWELEEWQKDLVKAVYSPRNPDGTRKTSKVSLWTGRGSGKTQIAAGFAMYQLVKGPKGGEVYSASCDRDKAGRLYKAMSTMVRADRLLSSLCVCSDRSLRIQVPSRDSIFLALACDQDQGHGLAPSCLVCDEVHLWDQRGGRRLYDSLTSGFLKRKRGSKLEIQISTAGESKQGLAWELYSYAKNVRDGIIKDPSMVVRIFEAPEDADWTDPAVWRKAFPCNFVNWEEIERECELAKHIPSKQYAFRRLYLGHWIEDEEEKWITPDEWAACQEEYTEEDLEGQECFAALDLSSVRDMTALSLFFPASGRVLSWAFLPSVGLAERVDRDGVPYFLWKDEGWLILTSGNRIVHAEVAAKCNEVFQKFNVVGFVADPYAINLIAPHLTQEPELYRQIPAYLGPPTKWLEMAVAERRIKPSNNPLLAWCASNVVVDKDRYENLSPHKQKSRKRIDPMVALIMAVGAWLGTEKEEGCSTEEFYSGDKSNWTVDLDDET